jgi:hypothetical protein
LEENAFGIEVDDTQIVCHRPGGIIDRIPWSELQAVLVETNSLGPFATDVFWVLVGREKGYVIPSGVQGEDAMLARLQQLPGFDNAMLIEAMSCTEEQNFLCWKREGNLLAGESLT